MGLSAILLATGLVSGQHVKWVCLLRGNINSVSVSNACIYLISFIYNINDIIYILFNMYLHCSATILKHVTSEMNIDHLVTIKCSAGKL